MRCLLMALLLVAAASAARRNQIDAGLPEPHSTHEMTFRRGVRFNKWLQAGTTPLPMNGGLLTTGGYTIKLAIGLKSTTGPAQPVATFDAIVDTGSSNTAVPAVGCGNCQSPAGLYNRSASALFRRLACTDDMCKNPTPTAVGSTAVPPAAARPPYALPWKAQCVAGGDCGFAISYGGGASGAAGAIGQDRACLVSSTTELCASAAFVGAITNEFPAGTLNTGIVGFAFPANSCTPSCQPTLLDAMVAEGTLRPEQNVLGMCLTASSGGRLDLGGVNASRATGPIEWAPIVSQRWYNIELLRILVNGAPLDTPIFLTNIQNDQIGTFPDSGTTVVLMNTYAFGVLTAKLQSMQLPHIADFLGGNGCAHPSWAIEVQAAYPTISFELAGYSGRNVTVSMNGRQYLMAVGGGQLCFGIAGVPSLGLILGDVILQNYYTVYDRQGGKVGFAPLAANGCT